MTLVDLMELLPEMMKLSVLEASLTQKLNTLYPLQDKRRDTGINCPSIREKKETL